MSKSLKDQISENLVNFAVISACIFASNLIINLKTGNNVSPFACIPTILLLAVASLIGIALKEIFRINVPAIVYTSLLATILSLPYFPWHGALLKLMRSIQFNALLTPILAFTGISIGKDVGEFIKAGPKLILVSILVFIGTYLGSAIIAQIGLMLSGQI